ncbi:MAG: DNA polymerase domain-containing protein [Roseiflexaceae bacterium]
MQDALLFGWDPTPGIVSVWAERDGRVWVWRRMDGQILCERLRSRAWIFATDLDDLQASGLPLIESRDVLRGTAPLAFCVLQGAPGRCRFLVSAPSWRELEQAILRGAQQRLGRRVASLYDLAERYYWVSPIDQYLIASGRVFFRGMHYQDLHRMQIDLETTALDPQRGWIFLAAIRDTHGLERVIEAPDASDEAALIGELCALVRSRDPDVIENHNLHGFDLRFLEARAEALGVPLPLGRREAPPNLQRVAEPPGDSEDGRTTKRYRYTVPGRELIDTLDAVRRHDFVTRDLPSHRLKDVARHFGIAAPERVYLAGAAVWETYTTNPELVRQYALDDVAEVAGLSQRLISASFALAGMAPRRFERLIYAGPAMGILEPMLVRAYLHAQVALPVPGGSGEVSAPHSGGGLHLFATGVAERVVKADVASLYPSLMIANRIAPRSDTLGALLQLVTRLTELRLAHKQAAREADPETLEHGYHQSLQAAMKLLINSAYGYMGAGRMALFADRDAADEVTSAGRAVLEQIVAGLRERGMTLIEADTDGVFFCVPPGWGEAQERQIVTEVAATLPTGIRLEYEGRYQAMFSHEVKNYALLTYADRLIVRGAAMRSSRSEPFGERFLTQALGMLLRNDLAAMRAAFLQVVADLRERRLTAADVATRVRLSKSPQEYAKARQREAAYEALLAAGRSSWERGERVRFYRRQGGTPVWLPDEAAARPRADSANDYDADYYLELLMTSYVGRLRKAFASEAFDTLFRREQLALFDLPFEQVQRLMIGPTT